MGIRRKSRELVIQTFYALTYSEKDQYLQYLSYLDKYQEILLNIASENKIQPENKVYELAEAMIKNIIPKIEDIDEIIKRNLGNIKIEKLGVLDVIIIRMAVFEMILEDTPSIVMINEAIELAKLFCAEKAPALINAILDKIRNAETNISVTIRND
ncbi:MAG: transcription antitermination factor NusB [Candidatus Cloacimonetes bacterium]|nr:transcription antitermination factor NusB [Candidatus Cloacimonadota bacterium]